LAEESILTDDFLRELMNVGEVDILVGVPTYNAAATVGPVVQAIRAGLLKYFPRQRAVIINADGGSRDATQELVRAASISDMQSAHNPQALRTLHSISTRYEGDPGSGRALYTILAAADLLHPTACAVISSDSKIEPDWIPRLLQPISHDNLDLVTPVYRRHKFDGLLVRNLVYPVIRALYTKCVREPYPSEVAFSGRLGSHFFGWDIWSEDLGLAGIELSLTIAAINDGFRLAQAFLGSKSTLDHAPADLIRAMRDTVGPLFWTLEHKPPKRIGASECESVLTIGGEAEITLEPRRVNRKRLYQMFSNGVVELEPVLKSILSAGTLAELQRGAARGEEEFCYSDELWVKTVYEFAASYHKAVINRDHIIQALAPLYRGKIHTFILENREAGGDEVERNVEALCVTFERLKPYFAELWNGRK
jgi:glycosyltransferase involved in cell wall biosynthesis